ncbi:MAG TPA: hypothetical protein VFD04_18360 [Actinomycetes bacterium]|nr:hypothetical protein [Actinomycetes bacterium]
MNEAARTAALQRLDALVGEWTMEAAFAPGVTGRAVFEWVLGGQFLVERTEVPGAPDGIAIVGPDRDRQGYTQHYYDSRGVARLYAMTFDGRVWTLLRDSPDFTPLDFWQRFTGELSADGGTISGRWETSADGSTWEHDFDLTYRKVR